MSVPTDGPMRPRDAFVLGAGFSMAISDFMPSMRELGERVLKAQRSIHRSRTSSHSDTCDGISCDWPVLPSPSAQVEDFETWLSALADAQPYLHGPVNDRRHALFIELTGVIAVEIDSAVGFATLLTAPPGWLLDLVRLWHTTEASLVTFNYDTLIEAAFENAELRAPDGRTLAHREIGPSIVPWWRADEEGSTRWHPAATFEYHKLHGSIGWFWDETTRAADSIVQVGIHHAWTEATPRYDSQELEYRAPGKAPMIVPPTTTKTGYFDNPVIRFLWRSAHKSLVAAQRVFVVGYSLPPGDILVRSMLADALQGSEVWIVNPDREVGERFKQLGAGTVRLGLCGRSVDMAELVRVAAGS